MLKSLYGVSLILSLLSISASAHFAPLMAPGEGSTFSMGTRDAFYCQDPDYSMIYNMSSGFDAEIADDIPIEHAGEMISTVTLWMGEWFYSGGPGWTDPLGIRVNFYHEACPPEFDPFFSIEVPWHELDKDLVLDGSGSKIYEVRVNLDSPLEVGDVMSLGATALIDWGHDEPFTGIVATPMYTSFGACTAWFDAEWWGYMRWTAIDEFTMIAQDLAYCLESTVSDAAEPAAAPRLSVYPNPFNPRTTLQAILAQDADLTLRIHDIAGRCVATLFAGHHDAGEFSMDWTGKDDQGRSVSAGVYMAVLRAGDQEARERLVLLK